MKQMMGDMYQHCMENPEDQKCIDQKAYCTENPDAAKCQMGAPSEEAAL